MKINEIDLKILVICKSKRKIKKIRSILADNHFNEHENIFKVKSVSGELDELGQLKEYEVLKSSTMGFKCSCKAIRFKKYIEGEKKHKPPPECIHILAVKTYLYLKNYN